MKKRSYILCSLVILLGCCLASPDSFAFAEPIVRKANEFLGYLLIIIRVACLLTCAVILALALTGRVHWKWIIITVVVAVLAGPGWTPLKNFLGVRDDGAAIGQGRF